MSSQLKRKNKSVSKVIKTTSFRSKLPAIKHQNVNSPNLNTSSNSPPQLIDKSAISSALPPYAILPQQDVSLTESRENNLFQQYLQYSLENILDLISAIADDIWVKVEDPKEAGKPLMQDLRHFQEKLPKDCVLKSHLMGTLGLEDATGLDRKLAELTYKGDVWVTSVDVQDVKEVIILAKSFMKHLNDLCQGPEPENSKTYKQDLTTDIFEEYFLTNSKRRDSGGSSTTNSGDFGQFNVHIKQTACPNQVLIYKLFREFLLANPGIRIVCRDDFVEFETNFFKNNSIEHQHIDESTETFETHSKKTFIQLLLKKRESLLWKYSNLLVNTGYLTLQVAQSLKTSFTSLPDSDLAFPYTPHSDSSSSPGSLKKNKSERFLQEQYIMNEQFRLNDDNSNIPMDGISSINHSSNQTNSDEEEDHDNDDDEVNLSLNKKNEPLFRISIPNIGNLLHVTRLARRWVLDSILGHKTVSTSSSFNPTNRKVSPLFHTPLSKSLSSSSSPLNKSSSQSTAKKFFPSKYSLVTQSKFKQMTSADLYERWNNKRIHNKISFYKHFKGINLETVFLDCFGGGWIEPLPTPVGTCWRYTGKAIST